MPQEIGTIIVVAILAVIIFFAGRRTLRDIRAELNGQGCSSCGGGCSGNCASCGSAAGCTSAKAKKARGNTRYGVNGKLMAVEDGKVKEIDP
ncbi:MAG: hypothetical protein IJL72_08495 [Lachnospiraceae bacterium]|nr:hypothetical protein [Lachnospiraceae bacterium]